MATGRDSLLDPIRHVRYELEEVGEPTLATVLEPILAEKVALAAAH